MCFCLSARWATPKPPSSLGPSECGKSEYSIARLWPLGVEFAECLRWFVFCLVPRGTTDGIGSTGNSHCFRRVASSTTSRVLSVFGPHAGPISLFAEVSWTVRRGIHQITPKPPRIASPISRKRCKAAFRGLLPEPWITSRPL